MLLSAVLAAVGAPAADAASVEDGRLPHGHTHAPAEIDEAHGPLLVHGWPDPLAPLWVAGSCSCVHQLAV